MANIGLSIISLAHEYYFTVRGNGIVGYLLKTRQAKHNRSPATVRDFCSPQRADQVWAYAVPYSMHTKAS
jgi:hypothetical protein